jgi:CubicO group peptidase (beta-lactamase class C family)
MYLIRPPNSYPSYSNLGFSLFGHLVAEKAMRSTFYDAIQRYVLDPLRMTSSGFFYDAQVVEKLARGHQWYNGMFYGMVGNKALGSSYIFN